MVKMWLLGAQRDGRWLVFTYGLVDGPHAEVLYQGLAGALPRCVGLKRGQMCV